MKTSHSGVLRSVGSPFSSGTAVFLACTACQISAGVYSERSRSCNVTCCKQLDVLLALHLLQDRPVILDKLLEFAGRLRDRQRRRA